jgi:hypothetical protein
MCWIAFRLVVLSILCMACLTNSAREDSCVRSTDADQIRSDLHRAGVMPEVRLRKLHLVRPDLLHYPIAMEICC